MVDDRDRDPHGQPYNVSFNRARRTERDLSELLGVAKGMLADGVVNEDEAKYLAAWTSNHPDATDKWPVSLILSRLKQYFSDGRIDDDERAELKELLGGLVGGTESVLLGYDGATSLPLDYPPPLIIFERELYVFTGRFAYGPRRECEREVLTRGGGVSDGVTQETSFLVVGTFGSRDWVHTPYGRKILRAVELRNTGFAIRIVGEDHWADALWSGAATA